MALPYSLSRSRTYNRCLYNQTVRRLYYYSLIFVLKKHLHESEVLIAFTLPNKGLHIHKAKTFAAKPLELGVESPNSSVVRTAFRNLDAVTHEGTSSELISTMMAVRDMR